MSWFVLQHDAFPVCCDHVTTEPVCLINLIKYPNINIFFDLVKLQEQIKTDTLAKPDSCLHRKQELPAGSLDPG